MIIWLASYPKSGNTWVRSFLCSYIYSKKKEFEFDILQKIPLFPKFNQFLQVGNKPVNFDEVAESWIPAQEYINLNNKINFLKTHSALGTYKNFPFTNKENTLGAIYLVRDPRDVLISYSKYLNLPLNETLKMMTTKDDMGALDLSKSNLAGEVRGDWSQHYNSWKNFPYGSALIVKYEYLLSNTFDCFRGIVRYLNKICDLEINDDRIKECIEMVNFSNLKKLEQKVGFKENLYNKNNQPFFNVGKSKQWEKCDTEVINNLEKLFNKTMKELKYI